MDGTVAVNLWEEVWFSFGGPIGRFASLGVLGRRGSPPGGHVDLPGDVDNLQLRPSDNSPAAEVYLLCDSRTPPLSSNTWHAFHLS